MGYYYWFFGKYKNYHYPTDDDIKFFYFTLFKKNGFIFLLVCCIIYRNCFLELLILLIRKYICLFLKYRKYTLSFKYIPILIIIMFNNFLNILFNSEKKIYQVLINIAGLSSSNSQFICKKFGFQKECTFKDLDSSDFEQLRNYLLNNFFLEKLLTEQVSKNVKKKIDLGTYQGKRHNLGYPVRGQRTLSNGKTQKNYISFVSI